MLYLTYDGLTDPLGQSQVLPYLRGLARLGHDITILSCDKPDAHSARGEAIAAECAAAGISWFPLPYRKSPPVLSTLADLSSMRRLAERLHAERAFDVVHCRSYLTALIGRRMQRRTGLKFLFDMRGFWIDERFERGIWSRTNPAFRAIGSWFRKRERTFFETADAVVSLTHAARDELGRRGGPAWTTKTEVIPCCVDLALFDPAGGAARAAGRAAIGLGDDVPVMLYLGSLGGAYPLEPIFNLFRAWAAGREDALLLFVTRHPARAIIDHPAAHDFRDRVLARPGERSEIPALVAAADVGVSFILPSFSAIASSPTKVGEMLAMGVPVAANDGVGDMARIIGQPGGGVLLPDLSGASVAAAARSLKVTPDRAAARQIARSYYSLDTGVATYDSIYRRLAGEAIAPARQEELQ